MDVLLVNPPWEQLQEDMRRKVKVENLTPSLGLGYIAAVLEQHGVQVKILDANLENIYPKDLASYIQEQGAYPKHIGITATSHTIATALAMARACKAASPSSLVTLGGVHPTVLPEETLAAEGVDYVIKGEGEFTYLELVTGRPEEEIEGLSFKRNGRPYHNPPRPPIQDINSLPFPAFHLMPIDKYHPTIGTYRQLPAMGVIGSRGCPYDCTYCASPAFWGRKVRLRSAQNIFAEISTLVNNYGVKEIQLLDDTFTASKNRVKELCNILLGANFSISWSCNSRVDTIDADVLQMMKASGCHSITYGIESADEQMLKTIRKRISLDQARTAIALTKKYGITCRTSFMFGNPGETRETMAKSVRFAKETLPDFVYINILRPYPGTEVYDWARKEGHLIQEDWYMNPTEAVMKLPNISREELMMAQKKAMKSFYMSPRYIFSRFLRIRSWGDLKMYVKGFMALLGA